MNIHKFTDDMFSDYVDSTTLRQQGPILDEFMNGIMTKTV